MLLGTIFMQKLVGLDTYVEIASNIWAKHTELAFTVKWLP
jgi:hypothetical protein